MLPDDAPRHHVLIPILSARSAPVLVAIGSALVRLRGGTGNLLGVVEVAPGKPIAGGVTVARRYRSLLRRITGIENREAAGLGTEVRVTHDIAEGIREAVYESSAGLLLLEWPGLSVRRGVNAIIANLVSDPPADLILVRPDPSHPEAFSVKSILVPVRGGPSARLALNTAEALAHAFGAGVTAMHVYRTPLPPDRRKREREHFRELVADLTYPSSSVIEIDSAQPGVSILQEAADHDMTVLGAQAELAGAPTLVSSSLARAVRRLPGTVVIVKSARSVERGLSDVEPGPMTVVSERQLSQRVDRWFAENTFHSREFRDIARLVEMKRRQGLTISLGLPTLNEAATVGRILQLVMEELVERHPLLDEVVVVDSGSTDDTVAIARAAGAKVVQHPDILPTYGSHAGKGEALWKSLHHLTGDLVAWCDTDISNFHPGFVFGTIGPLLTDSRIGYVKGFYKRPLKFGGEIVTAGGGRVTELTARPVINLFYPELSGLLQPLSGEYAGRREILEQIPFFTGYGVEIGMLIDILESYGLNRIAQVDLGMRIHRNQPLFDLSKMAFAIMQVALRRLGDRHRLHLLEEVNRSMKLIHYDNDRFFLEVKDILDQERPALARLPEYIARRHELRAGEHRVGLEGT